MSQEVSFNKDSAKELEREYKKAVENKLEQFEYGGNTYVTGFAKYLVEHLDNTFSRSYGKDWRKLK
jgi:hypothetical protein